MPYNPPGVHVQQVQDSTSPTLLTPDLSAINIGIGQYNIIPEDYTFSTPVTSGASVAYTLQFPAGVEGILDADSVYTYLRQRTGANIGSGLHLSTSHDPSVVSVVGNVATIDLSALPTDLQSIYTNCSVEFGYRMTRYDIDTFLTLESQEDVKRRISGHDPDIFNPLGYASLLTLDNAQSVCYAYGINISGTTESAAYTTARSFLETREVYAMNPLTQDSTIQDAFVTHAEAQSDRLQKHERIVFCARQIPWTDSNDISSTFALSDAAATCRAAGEAAFAYQRFRAYWVFPDTIYIYAELPVSQISDEYVEDNIFTNLTAYSLNARLASNYLGTSGVRYYQFTNITESVYDDLRREYNTIKVYVPCPSYYSNAAIIGMISRYSPEQPFTNLPITGISLTQFSGDYFTPTQLNNVAAGGNYILIQKNQFAPIVSRHQLSTDMRTIERRELSVNKTVDYCAKFIRGILEPYIGRYNITRRFLELIAFMLSAGGEILVNSGNIISFRATRIEQDENQPDTVNIDFTIEVLYPGNYFEVRLIF